MQLKIIFDSQYLLLRIIMSLNKLTRIPKFAPKFTWNGDSILSYYI